MTATNATLLSERYTDLSDRFRSLWTFYQFLGGLYKHQGLGPVPFNYDFQGLYRRLQEVVPLLGLDPSPQTVHTVDEVERELGTIHRKLREIECQFSPSLLRRLFDQIRRQDERILFALVKFYLQVPELDADTLDKLDILLTRLGEAPLEDGRALSRDRDELLEIFGRLADFARIRRQDPSELSAMITAVREFREQIQALSDFEAVLTSDLYDRYRKFKHSLGATYLQPALLAEIVETNIAAKNRFRELYQVEEARILEDTNRIYEIERYLERNPDVAHNELREQIEIFRRFRSKYDSGRKENNIKRDAILDLRRSMQEILDRFDAGRRTSPRRAPVADQPTPVAPPPRPMATPAAGPEEEERHLEEVEELSLEDEALSGGESGEGNAGATASLEEILPPDPLLSEPLHKIMFALELVVWDHPPERAAEAKELHNLKLEPWEVEAYRRLAEGASVPESLEWELDRFFLTSAALRVKMQEEHREIQRLQATSDNTRLFDLLESAAQSLERARDFDRRFQWFIDDMLFRGQTDRLEQIYRSRFRFLQVHATLWLEHHGSGGITPL